MYWRYEIQNLEEDECDEIIERAAELVETRKILMMDEWGEYALVSRSALYEVFNLLQAKNIIGTGRFSAPEFTFDEENH